MPGRIELFAASLLAAWAVAGAARADSPLTSTTFHGAYADVPVVAEAAGQGLTPAVLHALGDPGVPQDVRAAIVNALGWSIAGQDHARTYAAHLGRAHHRPHGQLRLGDLTAEEALALGYMLAMDDYLELRPLGGRGEIPRASALRLLDHAAALSPGDPVIALVRGLVEAQQHLHKNRWCASYRAVFDVVDRSPDPILRPQAMDVITRYMALYRSYC